MPGRINQRGRKCHVDFVAVLFFSLLKMPVNRFFGLFVRIAQ
jgi:hypothetical protein